MTNSWEEEVPAMEEKDDEYHYGPIHKLPEEVLRLILTKLSDPKSLLCCSLVSKHFASILSHSRLSISFKFPSPARPPYRNPKSSTRFLLGPFRFLRQITTPKPSSSEFKNTVVDEDALLIRVTKLLSRFTSVGSLYVELPCSPQLRPNYFQFSWVFDAGGKKLKTFAFLSTSSISRIDDQVGEKASVFEDPRYSTLSSWEASSLVLYATLINRTLLLVVSRHPNIESVEIMEFKKHGEVSLQGEQLRKLRNNMSPDVSEETVNVSFLPRCYILWYAPRLLLPRSGFAMERVTLGVGAAKRFPGDIDGLVADFENNGDDIFGEALTQFYTLGPYTSSSDGQAVLVDMHSAKPDVRALRGDS